MGKIEIKVAKQAKDILQKYASGLFRNATLEFYGVKTARIKELMNVELPVVEVSGSSTDFIFLLEDDSYLHYEFQSAFNADDLIRFSEYDIRLYKRDRRKIQTVVIYSADVKAADESLELGSLTYTPANVMMCSYDGDAIYAGLQAKLKGGQDLSDVDMLNLIFLPLMRNTIPKNELAAKSIELAQTIPDRTKRDACIASAVAFMSKYLNDDEIHGILEVLKMTDIWSKALTIAVNERDVEIAKKAIKKGLSKNDIADLTGLDIETIEALIAEEDTDE